MVSHFGPPTAASSTASARLQASSTSSVSAVPCASIDAPAEEVLLELEVAHGVEQLARGAHDLGADAVSGQGDDVVGHARGPSVPYSAVVTGPLRSRVPS